MVDPTDDFAGRRDGSTASVFWPALDAEERHHAVPDEFIDDAAGAHDRFTCDFEIAVQDEDEIIRQFVLNHADERTEIGEQHDDIALLTDEIRGLREAMRCLAASRK